MSSGVQTADALYTAATQTARRSVDALLGMQSREGFWWADLTADTTLESDYVLLQLWLHPPVDGAWRLPTRPLIDKAVRSLLRRQLSNGGFNVYPKGPADLSATVKAYFALKLTGLPVNDPRMVSARECILSLGGIQAANSYVKINLSLFDLFPRQFCPSIPPEMILAGNLIYEMSSWTRSIVIPLSIVHALQPRRPVPAGFDLKELFTAGGPRFSWFKDRKLLTWRNIFLTADRFGKFWERYGSKSIRKRAIHRAEQWMLERTKYSDGLGAIYPSMMYVIMALDLLGYTPDHPDRVEAEKQFNNLISRRKKS